MATTALTLDGFPLIGATPGEGVAKLLDFDGWLRAKNDRTRGRRSAGHGSWSSRGRRPDKPMTIEGQVTYSSAEAAAVERREMLALGGFADSFLQVTDPLGTLRQRVEIDDADVEPVHDRLMHFVFRVTALDPFARSTSVVTVPVAAGATVEHTAAGDIAAEVEVTLTSPGSVDLTIGTLRLRASGLPSGAVLTSGPGFARPPRTIRSALPANTNLFGAIVQPMQWPAMAKGDNTLHQAGSANLSVRYFPTYA